MKISVSFSGGRSSAAMCWLILKSPMYADYEKQFVFANTGQEHPATLDFVNECDRRWGLGLVWVEAIFQEHGKSPGCKVVNYETATRDHSLFEAGCQKLGLPNPTWKWCTRDLKLAPMEKYRKQTGFWDCPTAIGIRADELDRIKEDERFVYPLFDLGWTKSTVNAFWEKQSFDLQIPSDAYGNCVWCYKKSFRKLATVARHNPEFFEVPKYLEETYAMHGARHDGDTSPRQIYRKHNSTNYILKLAQDHNLQEYRDKTQLSLFDLQAMNELDWGGDCDQSCEAY